MFFALSFAAFLAPLLIFSLQVYEPGYRYCPEHTGPKNELVLPRAYRYCPKHTGTVQKIPVLPRYFIFQTVLTRVNCRVFNSRENMRGNMQENTWAVYMVVGIAGRDSSVSTNTKVPVCMRDLLPPNRPRTTLTSVDRWRATTGLSGYHCGLFYYYK